jgi:protein-S-isoprenylcysteine O-methyltransferase
VTDADASQMLPSILVGVMMCGEIYANRLRRREAQRRDNGSLYVIYALIATGYGVAFGLWGARHAPPPHLGAWALWVGAVVTLSGVAFRLWSVITLGQYFTYVVRVSSDQKVVETGPYRLLRHPSYTGGLLAAIGIGLSLRYGLAPAITGLSSLLAYLIRIQVEERALAEGIGEPYRAYMTRTKRLIPFVW